MSVEVERLFAVSARANLDVECSRLDRAWEDVVVHGRDSSVRPLVMESWNRCLRTGLDASSTRSPRVLSPEQVRDYIEANPVYAEVLPALPALTAAAIDSQHMLVYCDADGHIMNLAGEHSVLRRADRMNFVVGSHWGEDHAGTNAIGTAIITGTPVQLLGSEHYCQAVHDWTCSASPIRDPATNEVLAVIDMTGLRKSFHPHTLVAVMSLTQLIEQRLLGKLQAQRYRLLELCIDHSMRSPSVPIAILDRGRKVIKASPVLLENGWVDQQGRLLACGDSKLRAGGESTWEVERRNGRWVFTLMPVIEGGQVLGAVVQAFRQGAISARPAPAGLLGARPPLQTSPFEKIVGTAPAFRKAISAARSSALSDVSVLIEGETGTGKELIAQAIHQDSARRSKPFVAINCGALAKELATSEFFGYEGGSFTGAAREGRTGKFEQANGGTLFLDEIGDMPLDLQAILLRVLEEGALVHLGGRKSIPVDVRLVAATNRDLLSEVERGTFRRDLYYRVAVTKIHMPPLRERKEDLESLFQVHLERAYGKTGRRPPELDPAVLTLLREFWPGNIRELRNLAEWLGVHHASPTVKVGDLPGDFFRTRQVAPGVKAEIPQAGKLRAQEQEIIEASLRECNHNVSEAARRLGINRTTIYRKLGRLPSK